MPLLWNTRDAEAVRPEEALTAVQTGFWENLMAADEAFSLSSQTSSERSNLAAAYDPIIARLNADLDRNSLTGQVTARAAFANPYGRTEADPLNGPDWRARNSEEDLEDRIWQAVEARRAADPAAFGDLPQDRNALRSAITERVQAADTAAAEIRSRADGWGVAGSFAGTVTAALKDPVNIATLPVGLPVARSVVGAALAEAAVGAAATAVTLPDTNRYRVEQGLDAEDPAAAIAAGAAGGAVLGGAGMALGRVLGGETISAVAADIGRDLNPAAQWRSAAELLREFREKVKAPTPEQRGAAYTLERQAFVEATNPGADDLLTEDFHARMLADAERALEEGRALATAWDDLLANPTGPAEDPLVHISPSDVEGSIVARGGFKGVGDITIKGSGWGLVKVIWKHGPMSGKDLRFQVQRDDIVRFPSVIRDFDPLPARDGQRRWIVERADGQRVAYVDRAFAEDAKRRLVTVHVLDGQSGMPLSRKRSGAAGSPDGRSKPYGDTAAEALNARRSAGPSAPEDAIVSPRPTPRKPLPPSLRPPAANRPMSLSTWLARQGGIDDSLPDYQGWLRRMEAHRRRPGLVNTRQGMPLDDATLKAWENGYFPTMTERPGITDLLDALDEDLRGRARYRPDDAEAARAWSDWEARLAELDALGVEPWGLSDADLQVAVEAAQGRQAWERVAPGVPIADDEARALVEQARAAGRDVDDIAMEAAEARAAIFEAAGVGSDPWVPFDPEGDVARLDAIAEDAAERWRQAEIAGLEDPDLMVAWEQTGYDKDGRPEYQYAAAEDAFRMLDEEDDLAAQVAVCIGRGAA